MPPLSRAEGLIAAAALLVFLFFASAWIHLPGPQHDELLHLPVLHPWLRPGAEFSAHLGGPHFLPVMIMSYVGALKGWLLWLWFLVIPSGVPGYRAFGVALGLATVWLVFWFVRRHYGSPVALLTTALLATEPAFVHTIRLDYGPVALMHFLKMSGLCLLCRWLSSGARRTLAAGMFLFGLGLWDKANFIWFLAALGMTVVLLFPRETIQRLRAEPATLPVATVALLLGASPLLWYNLTRQGETWRQRGRLEIRWFKLLEARSTFEGRFMSELTGEDRLYDSPPAHDIVFTRLAHWMYRIGGLRRTILLPLLALALFLLPFNLWMRRNTALSLARVLFPLLLSILTYAFMFVSFQGGSSVHHVIMLQPFPLLFLAVSLWVAAERWPHWLPRAAAVAIAGAAIVVNLSVNARHLAVYTRTGGTGGFTDAIYRLVPYLARNAERKLYAMDWGFSNPVMFLGQPWNLVVDDVFFQIWDPRDPNYSRGLEKLHRLMQDPHNIFLLHSPQRTHFPGPTQEFFAIADSGAAMRQVAFFQERSGEIVYEVYQRDPGGAPEGVLRSGAAAAGAEIPVRFIPDRVAPQQEYVIEVKEFPNSWIDLVYHVDRVSSGAVTRFCHLDSEGRARLTVPGAHPASTVRITLVRPTGGEWRPARGSITVVR